jgi:hypothetical protein
MSNGTEVLSDLERINQIIDLCIDQDLYYILSEITVLSPEAGKRIDTFRDDSKEEDARVDSINATGFPVERVVLPSRFGVSNNLVKNHDIDLCDHKWQPWSDLFWAKLVRAEIRKHNKDAWSKYYDHLIYFLEKRMPKPDTEADSCRVVFHFLMELSAVAFKEASYGYAERARQTIGRMISEGQIEARDLYGTFYDRWVRLNTGLAYQHMGFHQKAVLEYNYVISKFMKWISSDKKLYDGPEVTLEFLFNVIPSIHQRAEVSLQLQLGYHALQTVSEPLLGVDINEWLRRLADSESSLIALIAKNMLKSKSLLQLKALLQLNELFEAAKLCNDGPVTDTWNWQEFKWSPTMRSLPAYQSRVELEQSSLRIRFVEESVTWFLSEAKRLSGNIKNLKPGGNNIGDLNDRIQCLTDRLTAVTDAYWNWVEGNRQDELVYFSRWARFLKVTANILTELDKPTELRSHIPALVRAGLDLYLGRHAKLPIVRKQRPVPSRYDSTLHLENFRSDDLPDLVNGLDVFYVKMSDILLAREDVPTLRQAVRDYFEERKLGSPVTVFKTDHCNLLDALDEHEREFGENKRISALLRCNKRLIWNEQWRSENGCKSCLRCDFEWLPFVTKPVHRKSFSGLLPCAGDVEPTQADPMDIVLQQDDYESIMASAEQLLTRHLQDTSVHAPRKKSLHFIGLQRWNSETPAQGRSVGGGYFIYRTKKNGEIDFGVAIDPGFDFVRNLFRMGFSLRDIDVVLISHAHPDHIWDFESMVQLLHEADSKGRKVHRLNVVLSLGSYQRLQHIINNVRLRQFINPIVIDIRKELEESSFSLKAIQFYQNAEQDQTNGGWSPVLPGIQNERAASFVTIVPTTAYHNDYTEQSDSFGFLLEFGDIQSRFREGRNFTLGYTGDTKWVADDLYNDGCPIKDECQKNESCWKDVASQYRNCDVLLLHLGSLIDHKAKDRKRRYFDYYETAEQCEKLIRDKNHPYMMGIMRLLRSLHEQSSELRTSQNRLILVGEFGEEMRGGIRRDFVRRLKEGFAPDWPLLPVDVGLDICLHNYETDGKHAFRFLCSVCDEYHELDRVRYLTFGQDEAIFYVCDTCAKATPEDVRQEKLRQIYETGRELHTIP